MKYFVANWKTNKDKVEVHSWQAQVVDLAVSSNLTKIVCPSFPHLPLFSDFKNWQIGAQTLSPFPNGPYTGAVSAAILAEFVSFVILGHAERRTHFGETSQVVARQATQALSNKITPIIAVDDHNWAEQLRLLSDQELGASLIMYEPPQAISSAGSSTGAVDVENVKTAIAAIQKQYTVKGFLYGGSVNPENIEQYFQSPIDGVVVGNASLDPAKVSAMLAKIA